MSNEWNITSIEDDRDGDSGPASTLEICLPPAVACFVILTGKGLYEFLYSLTRLSRTRLSRQPPISSLYSNPHPHLDLLFCIVYLVTRVSHYFDLVPSTDEISG